MAVTTDWAGRSLDYVRTVLGQKACYATAREAYEASDVKGVGYPPTGALCWYESNPHGHGNVAIFVGDSRVLAMDYFGRPGLFGYAAEWLGTYLGWSMNIGPDGARVVEVHGFGVAEPDRTYRSKPLESS